VGLMSIWLQK